MKKNFFKKLSFVLALAMIVSVIAPAAGVFAASKPKLNASEKYLFLGTSNEFDFNIVTTSKRTGWKYSWSSSNKAVATVASNGVVTGKSIGTAEISVVIKDKDGEEIADLTADVIVKDNIKTLTISNAPEGDKLAVGEEFDFNRSFVTVGGSVKKTTGITKWEVSDKDNASISTSGVFKATKAGKYTVTARAFQSTAKYNAWVKDATSVKDVPTDTYEVTVAASMLTAKQVDKNTVNVTFDSAMTDVSKNISVYTLVGTTKVKQLVKEVKMDATNKIATVKLYVDFNAEATYVIDYTDMTSVSFVAATKKVEDVKSMQITTSTVVIGSAKPVEVKLFNAEGVDITTTELLARVTLKSPQDAGTYLDATAKTIAIFTKGVSTTVTATFHTYKYSNTGVEEGTLEVAGVITGVEADATSINGLNAWTILSDPSDTVVPNFGDVKQKLAAGDKDFRLFVEFKTLTGSTEAKINSNDTPAKFEFTSSDESILIVNPSTGMLFPVKEGSAVVVIKYVEGTTKTPVGTVVITIGPKRVASNFTLSAYDFALSNANIADSKQVEISLKDQFNEDATYTSYDVEKLAGPASSVTATGSGIAKGTGKITFNGQGMTAGEYSYKITVAGISRVVRVTINAPTIGAVAYYKLELSATSVDLKAKAGETTKDMTLTLFGYASNGIKMTKETFVAASNGAFTVSVDAPYNADHNYDANYTSSTYSLSAAVASDAMFKVPVGSYKVTATKLIGGVQVVVDTQYFTVTDSQEKPVVAEISQSFTTNVTGLTNTDATLLAAVKEALKITLGGVDQDSNIVKADVTGTTDSIWINSVVVRQTIDNTYIFHTVNVNTLIKK